jgi:uncharacterized protein
MPPQSPRRHQLPARIPVYKPTLSPHLRPDDINHIQELRPFRILSIDGGGGRGMIPAVILQEVERRLGQPISSSFDRLCGTSTGSIIACGLSAPKSAGNRTPRLKAGDIVKIYRALGKELFSRGSFNDTVIAPIEELADHDREWWFNPLNIPQIAKTVPVVLKRVTGPLHNVHKLAFLLHERLGELRMKDGLTELFVYAYDIGSRTPEVLGSTESQIPGARDYSGFQMWQAATASSSAVPFFAPYTVYANPNAPFRIQAPPPPPGEETRDTHLYFSRGGTGDRHKLVDGGIGGLGNPSLFATAEETEASVGKHRLLLSLGTGHFSQPVDPKADGWGLLEWIAKGGELLNSLFDGVADTTDMLLRQAENVTYFRWQPSIPKELAFLDEGSPTDMDALEDVAQGFIAEHDHEIDDLVALIKR